MNRRALLSLSDTSGVRIADPGHVLHSRGERAYISRSITRKLRSDDFRQSGWHYRYDLGRPGFPRPGGYQ